MSARRYARGTGTRRDRLNRRFSPAVATPRSRWPASFAWGNGSFARISRARPWCGRNGWAYSDRRRSRWAITRIPRASSRLSPRLMTMSQWSVEPPHGRWAAGSRRACWRPIAKARWRVGGRSRLMPTSTPSLSPLAASPHSTYVDRRLGGGKSLVALSPRRLRSSSSVRRPPCLPSGSPNLGEYGCHRCGAGLVRRSETCSPPGDFATGCQLGRRGIACESQRFPGVCACHRPAPHDQERVRTLPLVRKPQAREECGLRHRAALHHVYGLHPLSQRLRCGFPGGTAHRASASAQHDARVSQNVAPESTCGGPGALTPDPPRCAHVIPAGRNRPGDD